MEMVAKIKLFWARLKGKKIYLLSENEILFKKQLREAKLIRIQLNEKEYCIIERKKELIAFENVCPHRGLPLHNGSKDNDCWVCPFHRHYFSLSGGSNPKGHDGHLKFADIRVVDGKVYVLD